MEHQNEQYLLDEPQNLYGDIPPVRSNIKRKRKIKRWYRIYLATTLAVVLLTVALLLSVLNTGGFSLGDIIDFESIASVFLGNGFMDMSQTPPATDPPLGTLPPASAPTTSVSPPTPTQPPQETPPASLPSIYDFDYSKVPVGHTPIVPMDLSLSSYGGSYILNTTGYSPDLEKLLSSPLSWGNSPELISLTSAPSVLIVHTHGTEAYSEEGAISFLDDGSEIARSEDISENVVAVGARLAKKLNDAGISTLHCRVMHDRGGYKDSYARAEETIRQYLEKYPSIKLVIDVHRDSILKSSGELVRAVTSVDSKPSAQVMCVVGSDWGGEECKNWRDNLSLALKLRTALNSEHGNLCRPTYLRPSTYNQELSRYSLLLEIGSSGNSLEEALTCADLVGESLAKLLNS